MKAFKISLILAFLLMTNFMASAAKWRANHVIFIGMDGWGSYSIEKAEMPNVKKLMEEGAYTLKKRSVLPSSSAINWASMFMGAGPEIHGYTEWNTKTPDLESRIIGEHGIFPTVFGLLDQQYPEAEIGCIFEWDGIKYVTDTLAMDYVHHITAKPHNKNTADAACAYILEKKPNLLLTVFDQPDHVGHSIGHDTPEYYKKLKELDKYIGQIVDAVEQAGILKETIFVLTADHGGIGKGHGGKTLLEMESPFIVSGKGVKKGIVFDNYSMMQFDVASTVAYIFRLEQPQAWIGRPVRHIFKK